MQEYLAASHLIPRSPDEIVREFEASTRRPWAQMLQFAVERHPEADAIINRLMAEEDDAFATVLRLIGQCIVNGAEVSASTKNWVGERLAEVWLSLPSNARSNIGKLIASGFTSPLPERVRNILEQGRGLYSGGREIVVACADPALTRAVLEAKLNKSLEHDYYLYEMQPAIDAIAPEVLQRYIERVKADRTTDKEIESLASLIAELSREYLSPQAYREIVDDLNIPSVVRLAGYLLGPQTLPEVAYALIEEVLRSQENEVHRVVGWYLAVKALWRTSNPIRRWKALVSDESLPEKRRDEILFSLLASPLEPGDQADELAELRSSYPLTPNLDHSALLLLADLGDSDAMGMVDNQLRDLSDQNLRLWAMLISKHRPTSEVLAALRRVNEIELKPRQRVHIASSLAFSLRGHVTIEGHRAFSLRGLMLHPAATECARMIFEWANEDEDTTRHLRLLSTALDLGYQAAAEPLADRVTHIVNSEPTLFDSFEFDRDFSDAISALDRSRTVRHTLSLNTLKLCVQISTSNTALRAIEAIVSFASEDALQTLIELHNSVDDLSTKGSIANRIEELAGRLGARIIRDGDTLLRT